MQISKVTPLSLWTKIRQRRITEVVFTYLAGGWIVLEIVDQFVDRDILIPLVYEVVLTLYLSGILGALIVGWYHGAKGVQKVKPTEIAMLMAVVVIALGASSYVIRSSLTQTSLEDAINPEDMRRIAVLYLEDSSRDGSMQSVADGITEGLIASLASVRELDVRTRNASREARRLGEVRPELIAQVLKVGTIIDGTVDQVGENLRVSIRLIEGQTGAALYRETYDWPSDQVATVGTELATQVAIALRSYLGGEIRLREVEAAAPNAVAWLHVVRAERFLQEAEEALNVGDADIFIELLDTAEMELVDAQELAPEWPEPIVLQSQLAYQRYVLAESIEEYVASMDISIEHANSALQLDPYNASALEWRGTAAYRKWLTLQGGQADRNELEILFGQARADLERAETLDPDRASVNSTLSHLYYQVDDVVGAALAARTAYEQDAFLDAADGVLWRLFTTAYDLGEASSAANWCEEGRSRFTNDFRFVECQILMMTMPGVTPNVEHAWELHTDYLQLLIERQEFFDARARMIIGGIIGLAGLLEDADAVMRSARLGEDLDPNRELFFIEGGMRAIIGDVDESINLLERYVLASSDTKGFQDDGYWWWQNLLGNPAYERLP